MLGWWSRSPLEGISDGARSPGVARPRFNHNGMLVIGTRKRLPNPEKSCKEDVCKELQMMHSYARVPDDFNLDKPGQFIVVS